MEYIGTIEGDRGLEEKEQIVIYGAGKVGRHVLEFSRKAGWKKTVTCFCDGNQAMAGKLIEEVIVLTPEEACARYPGGTYLVASMCVRQMVETLLRYGIENEKIHIIRESETE